MHKKIRLLIRGILRKLPDKQYIKIIYLLTFKRPLNLKEPKFWTEKVQYKKLFDRRDIITEIADKIKVREYVKTKLDDDIMPEILWVGKDPNAIPFGDLPNEFVIKTNHGSGTNIIVKNKTELNKQNVIKQLTDWLNIDYYYLEKEWAYKNIDRKVFVERLLYDNNGEIPSDIKLYMFHGKLKAINIHYDRFESIHQNILLNERFEPLIKNDAFEIEHKEIYKPKAFNSMLRYAEILSKDFDFIRVDFYDMGNSVVLGELTNYPVGGFKRMPEELDGYLGRHWHINKQ